MSSITLYPMIVLAAAVLGGWLWRRSIQQLELTADHRAALGLAAFCGAMIGAKLPFALSDWRGLLDGTAWFANGKTILTGLVGGYLAVEGAKWALQVRTSTGDAFVVPVALAIAVGRLGCFSAGCCFGVPSEVPWAMPCAAVDNLPRHPTQLYEFVFHLSMALIAWQLLRLGIWRGNLFKAYMIAYASYRLASEYLRPEPVYWGDWTAYQWFSLAVIAVFAGLWFTANRASLSAGDVYSRSPTWRKSISTDSSSSRGGS
ncbi:MAG: hypothetical protein KatS3mg111_1642 [Pirellulaceae bacterium]|nr:MAG: hypothetical protein KatS3mg111_1642 [Pirellulaceae bacterium]